MSDEFFESQEAEQPDWTRYRDLLRRRRWYLLLPFFVGWLALFSASWFLPSIYRSGTLILIEKPTVSQEYVVSNVAGNLQERLESIKQQILSRTLLVRIIDKLNLYPNDRARANPDDLVERMRKNIDIDLQRSSDRDQLTAFNIYFSADNPYVAQQVTTELTNILISENLEVRQEQSENTTRFLESQLDDARKGLATQEQRVREYKDRHLGELPGQLQSNLQILSGLQSELQGEQDALGRAKQQNAYLESLVGQYRSFSKMSKSGAAVTPGGAASIDQELDRLKAQLADMSARYTDQHPDVRKLKQQIVRTEKMKQQLAAGTKSAGADGDASGSDYAGGKEMPLMEVESQLKANQIEVANRQRSIGELQARIADYQSRLNRTPVREQELADITRDYDQSRVNYESLLAKKNQSALATNLEKRQQGEHFRMVDPPSLPTKPFSPNRFKLSCIGLAVGLVLGVAGAAGAEILDDRVYDEKEFKKLVPADVIVEIPPLLTGEQERTNRQRVAMEWAGVSVMGILIMVGIAVSYLRG